MKQIEYFGEGAINNINTILSHHNVERILLVTGKGSFESSGAKKHMAPITEKYIIRHFFDFSPNPEIEDVLKGIHECRDFNPDIIIAIGGGSTIDMGKLIRIFSPQHSNPREIINKLKSIDRKGVPLVAVPTTAGSGSEATHFAVVYLGDEKFSVAHEYILADYSVLDPKLTASMSPKLTAITGMDAFCHAVESYWAVNSTAESREYARESLEIILKYLEKSVNSPSNESRLKMIHAANLAGKAINISKTTAAHALSYTITKKYGVPHGYAAALTIGMFFVINSQSDKYPKLNPKIKERMEELYTILNQNDALGCQKFIFNMMEKLGLNCSLASVGINNEDQIRYIANQVNVERLKNHPVYLTYEDIIPYLSHLI